MKFIKKPVVIEAMQLTEQDCWDSWLEHKPFFGKFTVRGNYHPGNRTINRAWISIETLEGVMRAEIGDWIICGVAGEFYPCKNDIFEATYEPAEHVKQATPTLADKLLGMELGTCLGCGSDEEMQRHRGFHKRHLTCINWSAAPCPVVDEEAEKGQPAPGLLDAVRAMLNSTDYDEDHRPLMEAVRTEAARAQVSHDTGER